MNIDKLFAICITSKKTSFKINGTPYQTQQELLQEEILNPADRYGAHGEHQCEITSNIHRKPYQRPQNKPPKSKEAPAEHWVHRKPHQLPYAILQQSRGKTKQIIQ